MKRGIISVFISLVMIALATYRLWSLDQPKVGPVGDGEIPQFAYTSMYVALAAGIVCLVLGVVRIIIEYKNKGEGREN
ncbi:hypothetical protein RJP21_22940 [Paenibacillus sp. VCA1]|uniref:hypothetical protein n=1 Tax=Paenibacillus sp. VCA1 TaxID=3039148 RepID=UPI002870C5B0|nr:hypothetical protein [Paenibacillus sp. VCA1]MDR9856464.1 hypothetical protein [Paenibacillus sp. VCA1]